MTTTISFMSANYVACEVGYHMTGGWGQGDKATSERFRPTETFGGRFEDILHDVRALGFSAIDIWTAHLSPTWATQAHLETARALLTDYGMSVPSLAGWFGATPEEFAATCRIAEALGCPVLGGSTSVLEKDRAYVLETLRASGLKLGLENHPEKTPGELRGKIGDGEGLIGAAVDTGWFGTQAYDAARALEELEDVLVHVHLKDVLEVGKHDTCRFGAGVVLVRECVETLKRVGYAGAVSIEHEPELFDPTEDVAASLEMLRDWLGRDA